MNKKTLIIILTTATALIHLFLGFSPTINPLFILNGVGYLSLLAGLYYLPQLAAQRSLIRYALIGYAAITIVAYFIVQGADALSSPLGLTTKAIEVILIILLWTEK